MRGLLQHWTESSIILTSKEESVWRNKRPRSRTVSFAEDRLLTWSTSTSGSLEPTILSRIMPTYSLLVFEMTIFRNSIQSGTHIWLKNESCPHLHFTHHHGHPCGCCLFDMTSSFYLFTFLLSVFLFPFFHLSDEQQPELNKKFVENLGDSANNGGEGTYDVPLPPHRKGRSRGVMIMDVTIALLHRHIRRRIYIERLQWPRSGDRFVVVICQIAMYGSRGGKEVSSGMQDLNFFVFLGLPSSLRFTWMMSCAQERWRTWQRLFGSMKERCEQEQRQRSEALQSSRQKPQRMVFVAWTTARRCGRRSPDEHAIACIDHIAQDRPGLGLVLLVFFFSAWLAPLRRIILVI